MGVYIDTIKWLAESITRLVVMCICLVSITTAAEANGTEIPLELYKFLQALFFIWVLLPLVDIFSLIRKMERRGDGS